MSTITPRDVEWLWEPYLQREAINLITGSPKTGKSVLSCEIAARLSRGEPLPGVALPPPPLNVWLLNGEDPADTTIIHRVTKQNADLTKVLVTDLPESLKAEQVAEIGAEIAQKKIDVAILDPLQSWMGTDTDTYRANETRSWFSPFLHVIRETGCTFIFVRHRRKSSAEDGYRLEGGLGSIDISGVARSELTTIPAKKGQEWNALFRVGGNIGVTGTGWKYKIDGKGLPPGAQGTLVWGLPYAHGEGAAQEPNKTPKGLGKAREYLQEALKGGPKAAKEVREGIRGLGFSISTLDRARQELANFYHEGGKQFWTLTGEAQDGERLD